MNNSEETEELHTACTAEPMMRAIRLIGDVWTLLIVLTLLPGARRFNDLREAIGQISTRTLSQRLKHLEQLELVERRAFLEIPPRVEYRLTEKGQALAGVLGAIDQFAQEHLCTLDVPNTVSADPVAPCDEA